MGRRPIYDNDPVTKPISMRVGLQQLAAINSNCAARGCKRQEFLRESIDDSLKSEGDRSIFRPDIDWPATYKTLPLHDILTINSFSTFGQHGFLTINSLSRIDPHLKRRR